MSVQIIEQTLLLNLYPFLPPTRWKDNIQIGQVIARGKGSQLTINTITPKIHLSTRPSLEPNCLDAYLDDGLYGQFNRLGNFPSDILGIWWARATLYQADPNLCPNHRKPIEAPVSIYHGSNLNQSTLPIWTLPYANTSKPDYGIGFITMFFAVPLTQFSLLEAHYYLAEQTHKRVEQQIERQLGKGEAAKRILSAFALDYES